jgi:hypothetical protein
MEKYGKRDFGIYQIKEWISNFNSNVAMRTKATKTQGFTK